MDSRDVQAGRLEPAGKPLVRVWLQRLAALTALLVAAGVTVAIVLRTQRRPSKARSAAASQHSHASATTSTTTQTTGSPGTASVPILAYHVINVPPATSSASPDLYVPADEFAAQISALKAAGWHAVTLDQLQAYRTRGVVLGTGKPIVITFDRGYASQYTNALPVLKRAGWVGVENLQVSGLTPADGGLTDSQIRGLIAAGWELDTQGVSQSDLTILSPSQLQLEVAGARQTLSSRYKIPVNWFSYPSGDYDANVISAVQSAGFTGATTTIPGWAGTKSDRFRLPRLQVAGGTSPSQLMSQITAAQQSTSAPPSFHGP